MPEEKPSGHECRDRVDRENREIAQAGDAVRQQPVAVGLHDGRQWVQMQQKSKTLRYLLLADEDRRYPEPEDQDHSEYLRRVAQVHLQAGYDPPDADREQPD